ncbi:PLP-dependent aminotransferase family protein [Halovulum dunhuangense]|uniref:PLP-dependent aminotransferase family protein n=1 Tax=Halovulum dunhuangense TaxID=1505036 RepID=A0A849L271_9RHOB|nr:PLP-dependent aminotransferase family protein [Halovulum dunhuangense]NNU80428.1 PLP-dependent aminotransferase family protein [Halovulum dunhuangense]
MEPAVFASLVTLKPEGSETLVTQLYRGVRAAVLEGRLSAGEALPSSRAAASLLGVGRNTVNAAYDLLVAEGVIEVRPGAQPRVAALEVGRSEGSPAPIRLSDRAVAACKPRRRGTSEGRLAPGSPDPALFPADAWGRCLRRAARHRQDGAEGYAHFQGLPELRKVLADQLHRHRGLVCGPEDIVVTPGTQASLMIAAATFADPGDVALVESPGYISARATFEAAGLTCHALPVDAEGANPASAELGGARLIYVTPSTQYPTGVRMPIPRRLALLEAARAAGAVIVEDDYDSEFVWKGRGIAALAALPDAGHVVYLGSAAKSLLPGLRIGWMVAPKGSAQAVGAVQRRLGLAANVHAQAALAEFMAQGAYRAHVAAISAAYRERLGLVTSALTEALGNRVQLSAPDGGLQLTARLPELTDDAALREALNASGFAVSSLSDYFMGSPAQGLVIGFGTATARDARRLAETLARHLDSRDAP